MVNVKKQERMIETRKHQPLSSNDFDIVIRSHTNLFNLNLKEIWEYRDLILMYTKRTFQLTYKQTILGPAWIILAPLITSIIYAIVFGGIAKIPTNGVPELLFYMGGNAIWMFFSTGITRTATTFTSNARVFGKVYFPRLTMPISTVLSAAINFGVQMLMFVALLVYYVVTGAVTPNYFALPLLIPVLIQLGCLALGCGIIISSLTTKYRDLAILVTFGVQLWMFVTPVVYPMSTITNGFLEILIRLNPVTAATEAFRYIFLGSGDISPLWWGVTILMTGFILVVGMVLFKRMEKTFMDTV